MKEKVQAGPRRLGSTVVSPVEIGHMAVRLLAQQKYRSSRTYWRQGGTPAGPRWNKPKIAAAFGISIEMLDAYIAEYHKTFPEPWTRERIEKAFCAFVVKHKRWPRSTEFSSKNGLPSTSTIAAHSMSIDRLQRAFWGRRPRSLTPVLIRTIPNLTTRRDAITAYGGTEKFIRDGGGTEIQRDEYGVLWNIDLADGNDNRQRFVEVVNKSPRVNEDTGELVLENGQPVFDHYFLRVPPLTPTARAGVAWTFNLAGFDGFSAES